MILAYDFGLMPIRSLNFLINCLLQRQDSLANQSMGACPCTFIINLATVSRWCGSFRALETRVLTNSSPAVNISGKSFDDCNLSNVSRRSLEMMHSASTN